MCFVAIITLFDVQYYWFSLCFVVIIITLAYYLMYFKSIVLWFWLPNKQFKRLYLQLRCTSYVRINNNIGSWSTTHWCVYHIYIYIYFGWTTNWCVYHIFNFFCWTSRCVIPGTVKYQTIRITIKLVHPSLFSSLFLSLFLP